MGKLEKASSERLRKGQVRDAVLASIGFAGILLVAMAAPNTLQLLRHIPRNKHRFNDQTKNILTRLAREGLVRFVGNGDKRYIELTEKGRVRMMYIEGKFRFPKRKRWDGRWRVVMFDIPEKRRGVRDHLRSRMRELGFYRLQDSVWVFPFDCEDLIELIKTDLHIGSAVQYMVADIGNDRRLREEFSLPLHYYP